MRAGPGGGKRAIPLRVDRDVLDRFRRQGPRYQSRMNAVLRMHVLWMQEALTLRVKDLDFERLEVRVRRAKGGRDRVTVLPAMLRGALRTHLAGVRRLHESDVAAGGGRVALNTMA